MTDKPEYIVVGRFGRPRGVTGEIYINPLTNNPERFRNNEPLWIETAGGWKALEGSSVEDISGRLVAKLKGVDSPEQARLLTNQYLYVRSQALGILPEGHYYHFDLIGCRVVDTAGLELGEVTDIEEFPGQDLLAIQSAEGKRYSLPLVKRFLKEIDIEKKLIVIDPPEGIFDLPA